MHNLHDRVCQCISRSSHSTIVSFIADDKSLTTSTGTTNSVLTAETVDEQGFTIVNDLDGVENSDFYEMKRETGVQREKYQLEANQRLLVGLACSTRCRELSAKTSTQGGDRRTLFSNRRLHASTRSY